MSSMRGGDADLAAQIARLVERSPITADDIAAAVLEGIDRGDELIVPDEPARAAYALKLHRPDGVRRADARHRGAGEGARRDERPRRSDVREEDAFDVAGDGGLAARARRRRARRDCRRCGSSRAARRTSPTCCATTTAT